VRKTGAAQVGIREQPASGLRGDLGSAAGDPEGAGGRGAGEGRSSGARAAAVQRVCRGCCARWELQVVVRDLGIASSAREPS
jgi:hypothetical protein